MTQLPAEYLDLIAALVDCKPGSAGRVFEQYRYLLDERFMQMCQEQAQLLHQQGRSDGARRYADFAREAATYLDLPFDTGAFLPTSPPGMTDVTTQPTNRFDEAVGANSLRPILQTTIMDDRMSQAPTSSYSQEDYFQLVDTILQATSNSQGEASVVHPLLTKNLDKLNSDFLEALEKWCSQKFQTSDEWKIFEYTQTIGNFAQLLIGLPLGNLKINIDIAISALSRIEILYNPDRNREFENKIKAQRLESIEQVLENNNQEERQKFLMEITKDFFLSVMLLTQRIETYCNTCNTLTIAYQKRMTRMTSDKSQNLHFSIRYAQKALNSVSPDDRKMQGAIYHNMGWSLVLSENKENIENAIKCFRIALERRKKESNSQEWVDTITLLGNAYTKRIQGEPKENLRIAIDLYLEAQQVLKFNTLSWAVLQNNLGLLYTYPLMRNQENLENAVAYLNNALKFYTQTQYPEKWAETQNNLGVAYRNLSLFVDESENLKKAHYAYQNALKVRKPDTLKYQFLKTQINLGVLYAQQDSFESSCAAYEQASRVCSQDQFPREWASIQKNLAASYLRFKPSAWNEVIQYLHNALEVLKPAELPTECIKAASVLGTIAYDHQDWDNTAYGYDRAIAAIEQSRNWATSPQVKENMIAEALPIYGRTIEAYLQLNRPDQALLTAERSKARTLMELLSQADLVPQNATPEQQDQYRKLNQEIASLQFPVNDNSRSLVLNVSDLDRHPKKLEDIEAPSSPQVAYLKDLLQKREALLQEIDDPEFKAFTEIAPELPDFSQLLSPNTALIEWYLPQEQNLGAYAFIITHCNQTTQIDYHRYSSDQRHALEQFHAAYLADYGQDQWRINLPQNLSTLAGLLDLSKLLDRLPKSCQRLILVPHLYLHLYPLHALEIQRSSTSSASSNDCESTGSDLPSDTLMVLQDCFSEGVSYAPSSQILAHLRGRSQHPKATYGQKSWSWNGVVDYLKGRSPDTQSWFAIQNPTQDTEDLPYADLEVTQIGRQFESNVHILKHADAKKSALAHPQHRDALCQSQIVHFACHGKFNPSNPLDSALILADHEPLTLADIYRTFRLNCRLVVLSACKTGLVDFRMTDEYIGLPSGFILAGSPNVISTLWPVNDLSTALFAIHFYTTLLSDDRPTVAIALKRTQSWMRNASIQNIIDWAKLMKNETLQNKINDEFSLYTQEDRLEPGHFRLPYYWAAFCAIGA